MKNDEKKIPETPTTPTKEEALNAFRFVVSRAVLAPIALAAHKETEAARGGARR